MDTREYVVRYVITQLTETGKHRVMLYPHQGRYTYATPEEASAHMGIMYSANSQETLEEHYKLPLEVRPCRCYPGHFDPMQVYFEE